MGQVSFERILGRLIKPWLRSDAERPTATVAVKIGIGKRQL
jgi:hypothetical protein